MRRPPLRVIGLFFASMMLFTWGLDTQEIIGFDSRFYLFAQEMWRHGWSWFPMTYHQPYPDYPITSTWLIYLAATWHGALNKYAAILPSAIAAALTVTFTYVIGEDQRKQWGWYAACMLLLTAGFVKSARSISLDMFITCITVACFYLLYAADQLRQPAKARWVYALLVAGFALRGPIGLVIPTSVVCVYYLLSHRYRQFFIAGFIAAGLLLLCSAALLGLAWLTGGHSFEQDVWRMQLAGRINNYYLPPYFYLTSSLGNYAIAFPFALLSAAGILYYAVRSPARAALPIFLFQLIGWVVIVLVGMSIPGDKKIRYILPVMPAVALLASYPFIALGNQSYFTWLRMVLRLLLLFLPALLLLSLLSGGYFFAASEWLAQGVSASVLTALAVLQVFSWMYWHKHHSDAYLLFFAVLAFVLTYLGVFEPAELYVERARDFVQQVESMRFSQQASLVFYHEKPDGLPIKYLIDMPEEAQPQFIDKPEDLLALPAAAVVIARESEFAALSSVIADQFEVVDRGSLGHVKVVVFKKRQRHD